MKIQDTNTDTRRIVALIPVTKSFTCETLLPTMSVKHVTPQRGQLERQIRNSYDESTKKT